MKFSISHNVYIFSKFLTQWKPLGLNYLIKLIFTNCSLMKSYNVISHKKIMWFSPIIPYDKNAIKPGQNRSLKINLIILKLVKIPILIWSLYLPKMGFAAARTEVLLFRMVVIPALATLIVCCSMASWMAILS